MTLVTAEDGADVKNKVDKDGVIRPSMVLLLITEMEEDTAGANVLVILLVTLSPKEVVTVMLVIVKNGIRVDDTVLLVLATEDVKMASEMMLEDVVWAKDTVGSSNIDEAS